MRRVVWSGSARADYLAVLKHIAADDPDAAERVVRAIRQTGEQLGEYATGHPGRVTGTYEKSVRGLPYIIAYAFAESDRAVAILRVLHTAREWQKDSWPE
ncbi:type II toxin-antitoxin system RelE/ParE family toxin [Blastomonas aquatica]|uniref:Plasmid stabilization protein n=1 Tax=Blastomonas aquatica TaxID=1510276 RepID=A0ABQ1IWH5_9SPHN|nr:type II toxin-antitoxin system RelE/ParE family toxin [Blastomonas aquatica]GGB52768.1 plasmid stabilization protein [Blastomonas aquatica]